jgi:hypothetical protein
VFEKVNICTFKNYFTNARDYIPILYDLATFFDVLDKEKIVYHDACWDNILFDIKGQKLCVIDIDSMVNQNDNYKYLAPKGASDFHISFKKFETEYNLQNIKYLNVSIYHNLFFAFALGLQWHDVQISLLEKTVDVNNLLENYIKGKYAAPLSNGSKIDKACQDILIEVNNRVSSYIKGKSTEAPYENLRVLAK